MLEKINSFAPYLEDIRRRLYGIALVFAGVFFIGIFSSPYILRLLTGLFDIKDVVIATTSPFQVADVAVDIGLMSALLVTFPLFVYNVFSFLFPGLTSREKKVFILLIPVAILLFVVGFLYGMAILYFTLGALASLNTSLGVQNIWDLGIFLSQLFLTSTLLGIIFEFPLFLTILVRLGIITADALRKKRRVFTAVAFIFVALLPPTDGISLIVMTVPLVLLYEVTIFINSKK